MFDLFCWVTIGCSYLFAVISFILINSPNNPYSVQSLYLMFGIGFSIGTLGIIVQAKRDMYGVCLFTTVSGFLIALINGAIVFYGTEQHPIAAFIAIIGALLMIASVAYLIWSQYAADKIPNILREMFSRSLIFEADGVQFVVLHGGDKVSAGHSFDIVLFLQNCWDSERTVFFSLKNENNSKLYYPKETSFILPPGAVMRASVPVSIDPNANGKFSLLGGIRVNSAGGSRLRRSHAQGHTPPISATMKGLALLGGMFVCGGGIKINGNVLKSNKISNNEKPGKVETELIWTIDKHSHYKQFGL